MRSSTCRKLAGIAATIPGMQPIPPEALLETVSPPIAALAQRLREAVLSVLPEAIERVRPGWRLIGYDVPIARGRTRYVCWVLPEAGHAHLGFEHGALMRDPDRRLEGEGVTKRVRWLTFRPGDEIDPVTLEEFVREAVRVAGLSVGERRAIAEEAATALG
jgi:hypothetical protein